MFLEIKVLALCQRGRSPTPQLRGTYSLNQLSPRAAKQTSDEEDICPFTSLSLFFWHLIINVPLKGDTVSLSFRTSQVSSSYGRSSPHT